MAFAKCNPLVYSDLRIVELVAPAMRHQINLRTEPKMSTTDGVQNITLPIEVETLDPPEPIEARPSARVRICPDCCGRKHNNDGRIGWDSAGRLPGWRLPTKCGLCNGTGRVECRPAEGGR